MCERRCSGDDVCHGLDTTLFQQNTQINRNTTALGMLATFTCTLAGCFWCHHACGIILCWFHCRDHFILFTLSGSIALVFSCSWLSTSHRHAGAGPNWYSQEGIFFAGKWKMQRDSHICSYFSIITSKAIIYESKYIHYQQMALSTVRTNFTYITSHKNTSWISQTIALKTFSRFCTVITTSQRCVRTVDCVTPAIRVRTLQLRNTQMG